MTVCIRFKNELRLTNCPKKELTLDQDHISVKNKYVYVFSKNQLHSLHMQLHFPKLDVIST